MRLRALGVLAHTGSLTRTLRNVPPSMMTSTSEAEVSQRAIGITLVPWGKGIWNVGLRADYNRVELDGVTRWGPSFELMLTVL